ncbi:MAG: DNA-binding response regulator, partial [Armatimonadetes bacterium CG07_land_8_20_14_0_80_59_28]
MVSLLRRRLEATGRVEVVGEALTGDECVKMANALRPDALFLDIAMPDLDGIE